MLNDFSQMDIVIIRQQLHRLTDDEIADLIEQPVEEVTIKINEITGGGTIRLSKSQSLQKKAVDQRKKKTAKDLKKQNDELEKKQQKKASSGYNQSAILKKPEEQKYSTKVVNYSEKRLVRIDAKTSIYVNAGEDIIEAIGKYYAMVDRIKKAGAEDKEVKPKVKKIKCARCQKEKHSDEFYTNKSKNTGKQARCIECMSMVNRIKNYEKNGI